MKYAPTMVRESRTARGTCRFGSSVFSARLAADSNPMNMLMP